MLLGTLYRDNRVLKEHEARKEGVAINRAYAGNDVTSCGTHEREHKNNRRECDFTATCISRKRVLSHLCERRSLVMNRRTYR